MTPVRRLRAFALGTVAMLACGTSGGDHPGDSGADAYDAGVASTDGPEDASPPLDSGADAGSGSDATLEASSGTDAKLEASSGADATVEASSDAGGADAGCSLDLHGGPLTQTAARVGAFYFDGWSGGPSGYNLNQLMNGPDGVNREPLSGWGDGTPCEVEQQLAWAASYGIGFFLWDWYYPPNLPSGGWYLNDAFGVYRTLANHHGVGFAINYVDQDVFTIAPKDWPDAVSRWSDLFTDPDYVRVNGEPLFMVIDVWNMYVSFGQSHSQVHAALDALRAAAQQKGLPGVYVVGGIGLGVGTAFQDATFPDVAQFEADGYDAFSMYTYGMVPPAATGPQPFSVMTQTAQWVWGQMLGHTSLPSIPVATIGWDPRPENFTESGGSYPQEWFDPAPQDAASLVRLAVDWAEAHPAVRPEPSPTPPLVLFQAWNELAEGSYVVPTNTRLHTIGDAIGAELARGSDKTRTVLSLQATPVSSPAPWLAYGTLAGAAGTAVSGQVTISASPRDGAGIVGRYTASGNVPVGATYGWVSIQANVPGDNPGPAQAVLYQADYEETGDTASRIPNGDFSAGATGWSLVGPTAYVSGLDGGGAAIAITPDAGVLAFGGSSFFPVTPDANFNVGFTGRVAPLSTGNGEFLMAFHNDAGAVGGARIGFAPAVVTAGTAPTDASGKYGVDITSFGSGGLTVTATYAGDATHWPAFARVVR